MWQFAGTLLLIQALSCSCYQPCPPTKQEELVANYLAERVQRHADGTLAKQIKTRAYTSDSLSNDIYRWWVQLGLANHNAAIENFESMITYAGTPKQQGKSTHWAKIAELWADGMLAAVTCVLPPPVSAAMFLIQTMLKTWKELAHDATDVEKGGSADYLEAAMAWRANLPTKHVTQLLAVDRFINALKNNETLPNMLAAYDVITKLIDSTLSYRELFNHYYSQYLQSAVPPHNGFYFVLFEDVGKEIEWNATLWPAAPGDLDNCRIAKVVRETNMMCIDTWTPGLGGLGFKALVAKGYSDWFYSTWWGFEFSCDDLNIHRYKGCYRDGTWYEWSSGNCLELGMKGFEGGLIKLREACSSFISHGTSISAGNWKDVGSFPTAQFIRMDAISTYTCPARGFATTRFDNMTTEGPIDSNVSGGSLII